MFPSIIHTYIHIYIYIYIHIHSLIGSQCGRLRPPMGWAASSQGTVERQPGEPSWHRRERRERQRARVLVAVSKAARLLAEHHSSDMSSRYVRRSGRPWVCCDRCKSDSWVYLDLGFTHCKFCHTKFPTSGGSGAGGESSGTTRKKVDVEHTVQQLLDSGKCDSYKDVLMGIVKTVCPSPAPKQGAEITAASQRVCRAVRARDLARARLDKVPVLMDKMLTQMRELQESLPSLTEGLATAESELRLAREENEKALKHVHDVDAAATSFDDDTMSIVQDIQGQIELLQRQLEAVKAQQRQQQRQPSEAEQQQQQQPSGTEQRQQQSQGRLDADTGVRPGARSARVARPAASRGEGVPASSEMSVDEVAKRKASRSPPPVFDQSLAADEGFDSSYPTPAEAVKRSRHTRFTRKHGLDDGDATPVEPGSDDDFSEEGFLDGPPQDPEGLPGARNPTQTDASDPSDPSDPIARAERMLQEAKQLSGALGSLDASVGVSGAEGVGTSGSGG